MTPADGLTTVTVAPDLLAKILSPYQQHCRYLQRATVEYPSHGLLESGEAPPALTLIRGDLAIGESCYLEKAVHFSSVELNLCYNQLIYQLLAQCIVDGRLSAFSGWTLAEYQRRQLPDVLIHDLECSFGEPIRPERFEGLVAITQALSKRRFVYVKTYCAFQDSRGGFAEGRVSLVIVDSLVSSRPSTDPRK